jgi:hypothetical protein
MNDAGIALAHLACCDYRWTVRMMHGNILEWPREKTMAFAEPFRPTLVAQLRKPASLISFGFAGHRQRVISRITELVFVLSDASPSANVPIATMNADDSARAITFVEAVQEQWAQLLRARVKNADLYDAAMNVAFKASKVEIAEPVDVLHPPV